jgi:hypothetical protein
MDNEREVNALVDQSKAVFLKELHREFQERQKRYSLDEEFAKTKKNRSLLIPLLVFGVTVLLIGAAFFTASWIQQRSQTDVVGLEDAFSELNLRDVLDTVQRNEAEMQRARTRLRDLLAQRDRRILTSENSAQRDIQLIQARNLTQNQRNQEIALVNQRLSTERTAIEEEFAPQIAEVEALIAEIQERIDQYDARQLEQAQQQQEILNTQQQRFELERQQLIQAHQAELLSLSQSHQEEISSLQAFQTQLEQNLTERFRAEQQAALNQQFNRYNPQFTDGNLQAILQAGAPARSGPSLLSSPLVAELPGSTRAAQLNEQLQQTYQNLELLMARLEAIPYQNSVPPALATSRQLTSEALRLHSEHQVFLRDSLVSQQTQLATAQARTREVQEQAEAQLRVLQAQQAAATEMAQLLDQIQFSLRNLARSRGDSGYILDPRKPESVLLFATEPERLVRGTEGFIFREDSRLIGTIQVTQVGPPTLGAIRSIQPGEEPSPYDSIVFTLQNTSQAQQGE